MADASEVPVPASQEGWQQQSFGNEEGRIFGSHERNIPQPPSQVREAARGETVESPFPNQQGIASGAMCPRLPAALADACRKLGKGLPISRRPENDAASNRGTPIDEEGWMRECSFGSWRRSPFVVADRPWLERSTVRIAYVIGGD